MEQDTVFEVEFEECVRSALAGVPDQVVKRAEQILRKIERGELDYQQANSMKNLKSRSL